MPNTNIPLQIQCPKCQQIGCTLVVRSVSIITVSCVRCRHAWAAALEDLSHDVQQKVRAAAANT